MDLSIADEGKKLYVMLTNKNFPLERAFKISCLKRYEKICEQYNGVTGEPVLKRRWAKYCWGQYYMGCSDFIRAENAFREALKECAPEETLQMLPDERIKFNLLILYHCENDLESEYLILHELHKNKLDSGLNWGEIFNIYEISNELYNLKWGNGYLDNIKSILLEVINKPEQIGQRFEEYDQQFVAFVCTSVLLLIENKNISKQECGSYRKMLEEINEMFTLDVSQQILMYRTLMRLSREAGFSEEIYIKKCVKLIENNEVAIVTKVEIFQAVASFYYGTGRPGEGLKYLTWSMDMIAWVCKYHVRHLDKRVYQALEPMQLNFLGCYDMIHRYICLEDAYEKVLQFKALASLVGKERSRLLFGGKMNKKLVDEIQGVQDKIAYLETRRIFLQESGDYWREAKELRSLEAGLASKAPQDIPFTDITLRKVMEAIPDNAAVIEYFIFEKNYEIHEFTNSQHERELAIDIYVICKKKGGCRLKRWTVSDGRTVVKEAREFVCALAELEEPMKNGKEELRKALYCKLVKPYVPFINGIEQLYIAPDKDLIHLPFELLNDEECIQLEKSHTVVKIECARDFLFGFGENLIGEGSLVIGNPQFSVGGNDFSDEDKIPLISGSKKEAERVSSYFRGIYYSGAKASKSLLLTASGYRNIHIATHGYLDMTGREEIVYSACLLFAGFNNWRHSGKAEKVYGNGIVTADEISRLDLRSVELVVLSTCWSGMNEIIEDKGLHGLVGAFSQAGVRYVISHLWEVYDNSTAILMDHFYYQYVKKNQSPPVALKLAKQYLRTVTVGKLRKEGWGDYVDKKASDHPYEDEGRWGGFSCYRCN